MPRSQEKRRLRVFAGIARIEDCHERVGSDVSAHPVLNSLSAGCMAVGSIYGQKTPVPYGTGVQLYLWEISP